MSPWLRASPLFSDGLRRVGKHGSYGPNLIWKALRMWVLIPDLKRVKI